MWCRVCLLTVAVAVSVATASVDDDPWMSMPNGQFLHRDCIHQYDEHVLIADIGEGHFIVTHPNGKKDNLAPCPHRNPLSAQPNSSRSLSRGRSSSEVGYYSDWAVYTQTVNLGGISEFSSQWTVPPKPTSRGPAGLSSVYLFNGLEDGSGHHGNSSLILQPVLQFGKSGCLNNPLLWGEWHFTSYFVSGSGRAFCGKRMQVSEGEALVGRMEQTGTNAWTVSSTRLATGMSHVKG